jgi:hypothetical protein
VNTVARETPAASATCSIVVAAKPRSANSRRPASLDRLAGGRMGVLATASADGLGALGGTLATVVAWVVIAVVNVAHATRR